MRKKTLRFLAVLLVLASLLTTVSFAAESRASAYVAVKAGGIVPLGNGDARISFSVTATGMMDKLGASSINIHKADGTYVTSLYASDPQYANMMTTNNYSYVSSVNWHGQAGESYYAIIVFYAKNSSGDDYRSFTTTTVRL